MASAIEFPNCTGEISWSENGAPEQFPVQFSIKMEATGAVLLKFVPMPLTPESFKIKKAHSPHAPQAPIFKVTGTTDDGSTITGDAVWLLSANITSDASGAMLHVEATASGLLVRARGPSGEGSGYRREYWVAGLESFGTTEFEVDKFRISVRAGSKIEDFTLISGMVAIITDLDPTDLGAWAKDTDAVARRVIDMLSFANGHILRPSLKKTFAGQHFAELEFLGAGGAASPHKPPFYWLNHQPVIPGLVNAYDRALVQRTGLDVALEWHLMPHVYNEARFMAQMTAVEHLVHVFSLSEPTSTYIAKAEFKRNIVPAVEKAMEDAVSNLQQGISPQARAGLLSALKNINRRSLRANLEGMLSAYAVPVADLNERIGGLIDVRNNLVHHGLHYAEDDEVSLSEWIATVEELLRRIVFTLLDFKGQYRTWLGEIEDRQWPPQI